MWKEILDFAKQLFVLAQDTEKNKGDIKELRQELKEVRSDIAFARFSGAETIF